MTSSKNLISKADAFGILRTWHKNRELLLLETFSTGDKQRREFFVTTTEIGEGKPGILVTETRSFADIWIEIGEAEFFSLPPTDKYPVRLLFALAGNDTAELSEIGEK